LKNSFAREKHRQIPMFPRVGYTNQRSFNSLLRDGGQWSEVAVPLGAWRGWKAVGAGQALGGLGQPREFGVAFSY
jgi:hypothetical protein